VEVLRVFRSKKGIASILGLVVIGTFAAVALASPASPTFRPQTPFVTATMADAVQLNSDRVKFQTKGSTDVRVQKIEIDPGGTSGWHHHPGIVIVTVASGQVTFTHSDCSSTTYGLGLPAGNAFVEGDNDPGQASSAAGATVYATYVAPHGSPPLFRQEDAPQTCP